MDYFNQLGKPETDPDRIALREAMSANIKAVAPRNAAIERRAPKDEIEKLVRAADEHRRVQREILDRIASRPYLSALNEPDAGEADMVPVEEVDA